VNAEFEKTIVQNKLCEIGMVKDAMIYYSRNGQLTDDIDEMVFDEAYNMLCEMETEVEEELK